VYQEIYFQLFEKKKNFRKYEDLMAMYGMRSSKLQSRNEHLIMPFESPLLRKLAFSKLTDATKTKFSMTRSLRLDLLDRILKCSKSKLSRTIIIIIRPTSNNSILANLPALIHNYKLHRASEARI
jgi:hypothetical protein